ncbi:MAG: GIY-YIG nuclease family protein [Promethearchaeota archaeon]
MPAFYVYIIECTDKKGNITYYTGSTKDLYNRFQQHSKGKGAKYTMGKKLRLVYSETFLTNSKARKRENEIKKWALPDKKELIKGAKNENKSY